MRTPPVSDVPFSSKCAICASWGLYAADCLDAPWNAEPAKMPAPSPLAYLLRQRRWCGSPVPENAIFFVDPELWYVQSLLWRIGRITRRLEGAP